MLASAPKYRPPQNKSGAGDTPGRLCTLPVQLTKGVVVGSESVGKAVRGGRDRRPARVAGWVQHRRRVHGDGGPTALPETDEEVPLFPRAAVLRCSARNGCPARASRGWLCLVSRILELGWKGALGKAQQTETNGTHLLFASTPRCLWSVCFAFPPGH